MQEKGYMKSNLYTGTGDSGYTSLVGGQRVPKDSTRLNAYGTVDELSSHLGLLAASAGVNGELRGQLIEIQNELFNIGSYLATDSHDGRRPCDSLEDGRVIATLEGWIDALDEQTPKIHAFVIPGGHSAAAQAHVARTVCRKTERIVVSLASHEYVDPAVIKYLNRLSDYLFAAARYINFMNGVSEVVWRQGK